MSKARDLANGASALSAVSATELGYVDGVTSAIQTQIDTKLASSTAATTYQAINAAVSTTELGYLDGVTSAIQTQLNQKPEYAAGKNPFLNSSFNVWQRGTSFTLAASTSTYTADRWKCRRNAVGATISRQATNDTTNLPFIQYALRAQRDSGNATTDLIQVTQSFENINSIPYAGKTLTLSFYARAGANYSSSANGLVISLRSGTISDGDIITNTFGNTIVGQTATLTTTWQRFTYTGTMVATDTAIGLQIYYTPVGTASTNDYFEVTGIQLEVGSTATTYAPNGATYQAELAACQRYYYRLDVTAGGSPASNFGNAFSTSAADMPVTYPVTMRISPSSLDTSNLRITDNVTYYAGGTFSMNSQPNISLVRYTHGSAALTQYRAYQIVSTASAGYLGFNAEL